ncbi:MAG: transglutaminase-like cysteine peptidase [Gammaproteobacteria bacterium]|nr:transglutaminase-like cysteine peptidase [Gammaproteobacteria bacterium]
MRNLVNSRYFPVFRIPLAITAILGTCSMSFGLDNDRMVVLGRTSQPIGHFNYCRENPNDCASNAASPLAPALTRKKWMQMIDINHHANSTVSPVTDIEQYSREEYWTLPKKYGDCEDYVLLKRQLLIDKGWPVSSLLVTVVLQTSGEGHAVLTVRTKDSDYILDNLNGKILPWNKTEYRYLKRQSTMHSGRWTDIEDNRDIVGSIK